MLQSYIGQYLAEDKGATLELRRTFDNGWKVGVWATKTDVSAKDFGEGSFDKGLYFRFLLMQYLAKIQEIIINHALDPFREMVGQDLRDILVNCGIVSEMLDMILSIGIRVE